MQSFVIEFNRHTRERTVHAMATPREAIEYRLRLEQNREDSNIEIVVLTSASLETLERTHSRYFTGKERLTA